MTSLLGRDLDQPREVGQSAAQFTPQGVARWIGRRLDAQPAWVLMLQLFFGIGWLRAAADKLLSGSWWSGRSLERFLSVTAEERLPWYDWLTDELVAPHAIVVSVFVAALQLVIGFSLVSGRRISWAAALGAGLSANFLAAGAVNPAIFYLVGHTVLLLWVWEHSVRPVTATGLLKGLRTVAALAALASIPFVSTFDPNRIVEEPPAVLAFYGLLTVAGATASIRQLRTRSVATAESDPRCSSVLI